jgi:predicted transcriptional regulator
MAKELSLALIETGNVPAEDMQDTLQTTHTTLLTLKAQEAFGTTAVPVGTAAPVNWRKSITKHAVACLECGKTFRQLSTHHLKMHGLDSRSYRAKYGIPHTQSLAAETVTARRRKITQETRPWEKTLRYRRAQERDGKAPAEEGRAASEEAKAPAAAAPTTATRGRKSAPKKAARKKSMRG